MIDIRDAGTEVFVYHKPRKFYAFCGEEYGVKLRYMAEIIKTHGGKSTLFDSVRSVMTMLNAERIFQLEPTTYIIRYDQSFIKDLDADSSYEIDSLDFDGTVIVLYESDSDLKKCEKWIPEYTVKFDPVNRDFLKKYLEQDYPDLGYSGIEIAVGIGHSYIGAQMICESLSNLDFSANAGQIRYALSPRFFASTSAFRNGVAARDFRYCVQIMESSEDDAYSFLYAILNTMLEIEKCIGNEKAKSWASRYVGNWTSYDAVTVFSNAYRALKESRTLLSYDVKAAIIRILSSMRFSPAIAV